LVVGHLDFWAAIY